MLLKDLIETLNKSDSNKFDVDVYDLEAILSDEFGINTSLDYNKTNNRVTCYWLLPWYCTDTWVGFRVYFLDDRILAMSYQSARKNDETFTFANKEVKQELKNYIISLIEVVEENIEDSSSYLNLDEDFGIGNKINYACQLLSTHVMYEGQRCKIIYPYGEHANGTKYRKLYPNSLYFNVKGELHDPINIELPDGSTITVELKDVHVCYNTVES